MPKRTRYPALSDSITIGTVYFGDGSVGTPSITFESDKDTGLYNNTLPGVGITVGGSDYVSIGEGDEAVLINSNSPARIGLTVQGATSQTSNLQEWQSVAGGVLSAIDSDGDLVIGGTGSGRAYNVVFNKTASGEGDIVFRSANTNYGLIRGSSSEQLSLQSLSGKRLLVSSDEILLLDATTDIRLRIGANNILVVDSGAGDAVTITPQVSTDVGLLVKGASSQSANLQEWQDNSGSVLASIGSSGSLSLPIETVTSSSDTLDDSNHVVLCDCTSNAITINLPASSGLNGRLYHIKKIDSTANAVTVDGSGSETIDGSTTATISSQYDSIMIVCDGSNWHII